jgi:hypothetical protein
MGKGILPEADVEIRMDYRGHGRTIEINALQSGVKNYLELNWKNKDILL